MGLLRLAVLGTPEVFHDGTRLTFALRKSQALLIYLAVEGGMHSRSKLTALLWPDSESRDARRSLRNALTPLRGVLSDDVAASHTHLICEGDLLGLNRQAPLELDLDVVQQVYGQALRLSTAPPQLQGAIPIETVQHALTLVRGPFLDGFWLGEETPFDDWVLQQQQQWQMRLQVLYDRLSSWQEATGELEQSKATLASWLALDPFSEEAARRLMRLYLAVGDATAAGRVYSALCSRLAQQLRIKPSPETVALAERIRANAPSRRVEPAAAVSPAAGQPPGELVAPLIGRGCALSQLVARYQQLRQGQAQGVLLVGEAGIGKTRLAKEFVSWARVQGADVLIGHAFEMRVHLPYQPLSQAETCQLLQALVREQEPRSIHCPDPELQSPVAKASKRPLEVLGDILFAQTGGQPLYLLETLKLLCERMWLAPQPGGDGTWRLEPCVDLATTFAQEQSRRELLPASVRAQVRARLAKLSPAARQVADVGVQAGIEALEEAVRSGILREVVSASGQAASYGFAQELLRQVVLTELGEARRQVLSQRAASRIEREVVKLPQRAAHVLSA